MRFDLYAIGTIRLGENSAAIDIDPRYADALLGLETFSHILVFYWFHENDTPEGRRVLQLHPRADPENPLCGVFATHSPRRPNLIALTTCRILSIRGNTIRVERIDAKDKTPVIDIKCYIPEEIDAADVTLPDWVVQHGAGSPSR
jgi:tRNA-Thr(GGU) m(6)t(6)A37 methyltransferase TsaA